MFERVPDSFDFSNGVQGVIDLLDQDIFDGFSDVIEAMGGGPRSHVSIRMFGGNHSLPRPWILKWYEALAYWLSVLVTLSPKYFPGMSKDPLRRLLEEDGWTYNHVRVRTPIDYRHHAEIEPADFAHATSELYVQAKKLHAAGVLKINLDRDDHV